MARRARSSRRGEFRSSRKWRMALDIRVPPLGESLVDATVGQWLKREGDAVKAGEPVVELETEKVNLEVSAEASGVLERIDQGPGSTVHVGEVLGSIATDAPPVVDKK